MRTERGFYECGWREDRRKSQMRGGKQKVRTSLLSGELHRGQKRCPGLLGLCGQIKIRSVSGFS